MQAPAARPSLAGRILVLAGAGVFVASLVGFLDYWLRRWAAPAGEWSVAAAAGPVAIDAALFTAFALHHSLFARLGLRAWVQRRLSLRYERSLYVWISSVSFIVVYVLWRPVPGVAWRATGAMAWALGAVQVIGILMSVQAARRLDVFDLAGVRQGFGRASRHPGRLIDDGLYGFVRHPIYLGWILVVFTPPVMTGTRLAFAAISTAYLAAAVPFEERTLGQVFGDAYARYARRVRWRMLPGVS
jgi:hypothetical protein